MTFDTPSLLVLGTALLVALLALDVRARRPRLAVWLAVLVLALGSPSFERAGRAGDVVLLVDDSASVGDRHERGVAALRQAFPEAEVLLGGQASDLGGLLASGAARLPAHGGALILVSDGLERGAGLDSAVASMAAREVPVHIVAVPPPPPAVRLVATRHRLRVAAGDPLTVSVSLAGGPATVMLRGGFRGASPGDGATVRVGAGDSPTAAEVILRAPNDVGLHELTIEVLPVDDVAVMDGLANLSVVVGDAQPVALLGEAALPHDWPQQLMPARAIAARAVAPGELSGYAAVLCAGRLDPAAARALGQAVQRGETGLVLQGGSQSFGAGGWQLGPLGELSPLDPEPEDRRPVRVVLLADRSGSMTEERVQATRAAAARLLQVMGAGDWLALIPYAEGALPAADLAALAPVPSGDERERFLTELLGLYPPGQGRGGTALAPAVQRALELLVAGNDDEQRLLVVITDAELGADDLQQTYDRLRVRQDGVEVVVLLTGTAPGGLAADALRAAGVDGVSVRTAGGASARLGELLANVFDEATGSRWVTDAPAPAVSAAGKTLGVVGLVNRTRARPEVTPEASAGALPLMATWQRGRGRVTAVAGRPGGDASAAGWGGGVLDSSRFWEQRIRAVAPAPVAGSLTARSTSLPGGRLEVRAWVRDTQGAPRAPAVAPRLELIGAAGRIEPGPLLTLAAPGSWVGQVRERDGQPYAISLGAERVQLGMAAARSPELARLEPDLALLRRIAGATGGGLHAEAWLVGAEGASLDLRRRDVLRLAPWLLLAGALAMAAGTVLPVAHRAPTGIA